MVNAKAAIDTKIAEIKAATEWTVTFMNGSNKLSDVPVLKNGTITRPTTDPTMDGYVFKNWYSTDTLTTTFDFSTSITANTTLYAGWYDIYSTNQNVTINTTFKDLKFNDNTVVNFKDGVKTIVSKDNNNADYIYTVNSDATNGVSIDDTNGFKFKNVNAYISFVVSGTATIEITLKIGSDGRGIIIKNGSTKYCSIYSGGSDNTDATFTYGTDTNGIDIQKKKSDTRKITLVNVPAGTYYISTYASQDTYIKSINITESATVSKTISSITATVLEDDGMITIDDIKLIDTSDNEIAINNGVDVEVRDSGNNVVDDLTQPLPADTYTVTIKYGTYTVYTKSVTIKHTVTINGTEYKIADGETLGTNLPASATKADVVGSDEIITKYTFTGWQDEYGNDVNSSTVVTSDMIITPVFSETYAVNTFVGLQNIIAGDESAFSLDGDIELTADINVDYAFILDTKTYSFTGTGKFILDTNGEIISTSDIGTFVASIDNLHEVTITINSGEYTYTLDAITFTDIKAYYTVNGNVVTLDAVKLIPNGSTNESEYVEITSGFTATLKDLNEVDYSFGTSLSDGGYKITVTYGTLSFTKMFDIGGVD